MIGRADLLDMKKGIEHWKARGLDFTRVFHQPQMPPEVARYHCESQDHGLKRALDHQLIVAAEPALERGETVRLDFKIRNAHRSVGAMLSGAVARKHGHEGLPPDTIHVAFAGIAGQSFGAFLARGITFELQGATNDYVGKGLSGGRIVVYPDPACPAPPAENIVIGNTVMYGAIEGEAYFRGVAGERFCVRNSGASAVVEGTGDHGCEYMTGGTVVVLGRTGRNFAAGMSGGIAYVYDPDGTFAHALQPVDGRARAGADRGRAGDGEAELAAAGKGRLMHRDRADEAMVRELIERHLRYTGSTLALELLDNWEAARAQVRQGVPARIQAGAVGNVREAGERCPDEGQEGARGGLMGKITGFLELQRIAEVAEPVPAARSPLSRVRPRAQRRRGREAGRALHGLRHPVLPDRLPGQQHHSRLERPGLPPPVAAGARRAAFDEQLSRIHRPRLPRAVRGGVHAQHQQRSRRHQVDRALHHRQGLGGGLGRAAAARAKTGRRVAVVGSGPAGMACAQQLARAGHDVVLFEKDDRIGGLLRYGIPDFKMEKHLIDRRMAQMAAEGVEFRPNVHVGVDVDRRRRCCARVRCGRADRRRRAAARPAGARARSRAACISRWTSCRSRIASSPATRVAEPDRRHGQARHRHRRRRHRLRLRRHVEPPGRAVGHAVRAAAAAARQREQAARVAVLADQAAHVVVARGRLRARLGGRDQALRRPRTARSRSWLRRASNGRRTAAAHEDGRGPGQRIRDAGRSRAARDGLRRSRCRPGCSSSSASSATRAATSRRTPTTTGRRSTRYSPPATCAAASRWSSGRSAKAASARARSTSS